MLHPNIGGVWMSDIGPFGEVTYTENRLHGCETATWQTAQRTRHRALVPGSTVVLYEATQPCWWGRLDESGRDGTFKATGWHVLGRGVLALDAANAATANPNTAAHNARVTRGAVPWGQPATIHNADVGEPQDGLTLNELLDRMSTDLGVPWRVNHFGELVMAPAPATPKWALLANEDLLSTVTSNYVTHLNVHYLAAGGIFTTIQAWTIPESAAAATRFGRVEDVLDLTEHGIITAGAAEAAATEVLEATGPKLVVADPIACLRGQLRRLSDQEAGWGDVHAGDGLRLWGGPDRTAASTATLYTDVIIGSVNRTRSTLTLTPEGAPATDLRGVIADIVARFRPGPTEKHH